MKKPQTPRKITRAALYALVWETPMHTLAPEFGISDVGVAKLCRRCDSVAPYATDRA